MLLTRSIIIAALALLFLAAAAPATAQIGGDVGIIQVTSSPSGASVNYGGQYEGTTPVDIKVYSTSTPGQQIVVSLSGYKTFSTTAPNPGAGQTEYIHAVLEPIAPTPTPVSNGYFAITSSPSGATVRIDGHYSGTTPLTTMVTAGTTHRVQIEYSGYESWSAVYTAYSGQTTQVYATLTPNQPATGYLAVTSSPSGADVYVDGSYRGYAPMTVGNLYVGSHTVEFRKAGYQVYTSNVQIYSGQTSTVNAVLSPSTPNTGSVAIQSFPSGVSIFLDNNYQGTTLANDYFDIIGLSTGRHSVMLRKPGYYDYTTDVTVTGGAVKYVTATMTQQSTPVSVGKVNVNSAPSGAEVYIDNLFRGYAPVVVPDIAPGTHSISLKMQGFSDWISTVQVNAGQTAQVVGTLTPTAVLPTPTPSGTLPIAAVGALALFGVLFVVTRRR
ncbi:PEGA domain-containing protein [Methanocalculus sp.]|uniref:PEGA domain-containing protein n=1 Tax=Methanocalculus sp. TaxID=2004547 RepID=UPI0027233D6F|nr:PEGA domain-containing protein [Methanocalculus sp.]MDO8841627.1 PEGA domain-containing protein [Methanocalculus sp.]